MKMGSPVKDQYWTSLGHKVLCSNGETRKSPGERSIQTRSTRDGSPVCELVPEPNQFSRSADPRFCTILPDPSANGESNLRKPLMWEQFACERYVSVSNSLEAKWIQSLKNQSSYVSSAKQIDFLDVYAQPNSRLAEEVQKKGGRVMRLS